MSDHCKVEINEEPEIQFLIPNPELGHEIKSWLFDRGATQKIKKGKVVGPKRDATTYWDSSGLALLDQGCEYRVKEKGSKFRHDLKTPLDTHDRCVTRDKDDIFWRNEYKFEETKGRPSLVPYFGQAGLMPIAERKHNFFGLKLEQMFRASFFKDKLDIDVESDDDDYDTRIEYSFQQGHMESLDGQRRTPHMHILELERREGDLEGLLSERDAVKAEFEPRGLILLPERKLFMGFRLIEPGMTARQRSVYERALERVNGEKTPIEVSRLVAAI